jgi:hypothetical protein
LVIMKRNLRPSLFILLLYSFLWGIYGGVGILDYFIPSTMQLGI